jgi:hypothetical protein
LWFENFFDWFCNLLLGKRVKVLTCENVGSSDVVPVEVLVPWEDLKKSTCLSLCLSEEILNKEFVPVSAFMDTVGLSCISRTSEFDEFLHFSCLPPLVVKLTSSREFTCLMSHVTDDMLLYLHPVQENSAHDITFIDNELYDHYSTEKNCAELSYVRCGSVCSVHSVDFQQWCRCVVVSLKNDGDGLECLIFYLDYGGSEWVEPSKLLPLPKSVRKLPPQVVCCSFEELTAKRRESENKEVLTNPDFENFKSQNNYACSIVSQELVSKGVQFITAATEEKQLFVVIKETG